jgi:GNAT superfamily N-acetyltransferase
MSEELSISKLRDLPRDLDRLVQASLAEGFGFLDRLREEWETGANRFARPGEVLFEARRRGQLVGICGLNRDPYLGSATAGRVRRLYVAPEARRLGIARRLVHEVLREAHERFTLLRLRTDTREGALFYQALGFHPTTGVATATHELRLPFA